MYNTAVLGKKIEYLYIIIKLSIGVRFFVLKGQNRGKGDHGLTWPREKRSQFSEESAKWHHSRSLGRALTRLFLFYFELM